MKVYLVDVLCYDGFWETIGVFSTDEKAGEAGDKDMAERKSQDYTIREFELDKYNPVRNP